MSSGFIGIDLHFRFQDMLELRADVTVDCNFFKEKFARLEELTSFALEEQIAKMRQLYEDKLAEAEKERQVRLSSSHCPFCIVLFSKRGIRTVLVIFLDLGNRVLRTV